MQIVQVQFMQLILLYSLTAAATDATTTSIVVCIRASAKPNNMFIFQFSAVFFFIIFIFIFPPPSHLMVLQGFKIHFPYYCYCKWFESPDSIIPFYAYTISLLIAISTILFLLSNNRHHSNGLLQPTIRIKSLYIYIWMSFHIQLNLTTISLLAKQ